MNLYCNSPSYFVNQFLIAMPGMVDSNFAGSVVYLCEHNKNGAMGLIINRPTDVLLGIVFEQISLNLEMKSLGNAPVYFGGPVQTDHGFVLHEQNQMYCFHSSLKIPNGAVITTSRDFLEAVSAGKGPKRFLMTLGYSGWRAGQLEEEIANNSWLNVSVDSHVVTDIIFNTPYQEKYEKVLAQLGVDLRCLYAHAGHA